MRRSAFVCRLPYIMCFVVGLTLWPSGARAERLPVKRYTLADGLARDQVTRIVRDSKGFLWFCTSEGLSRFDGYRFTTYSVEQGLPGRIIYDLLETRGGVYWVATNNGLCRFNPDALTPGSAPQRFIEGYDGASLSGHALYALLEDSQGVVWCGGSNSFFRLEQKQGRWVSTAMALGLTEFSISGMVEGGRGALWLSLNSDLYRRQSDGRLEHFGVAEGLPLKQLTGSLLKDRSGSVWVGTAQGLYQLVPEPHLNAPTVARLYTTRDGLSANAINSLLQSADGCLWAGLSNGEVSVALPDVPESRLHFQSYGKANGIINSGTLAEDRDGNVWVGTESDGALKLAANGFTTYDESDGFVGSRVGSILLTQAGDLCVASMLYEGQASLLVVNRFDGQRFEAVKIGLPPRLTYWGWGWYQTLFQSQAGEWWVQTGQGVVRYPQRARLEQLPHRRPQAVYTYLNGLADEQPFRIFEDSRGDVWIGTFSQIDSLLTRWERRTGNFHRFTAAEGAPQREAPTAFGEDASGNLWIGLYGGGVLRYRDGHLQKFSAVEGLPGGLIRAIYLDHARRLWLATGEGGAVRIDDPTAAHPKFIAYDRTKGLASNQATCFTEDQWGRIYIGTGRGVDQLDPTSGQIKHFTTADGLANNFVSVALRDRAGTLWFGTLQGLSRFTPRAEQPRTPPPILLGELNLAGVALSLPALGTPTVAGLTVPTQQNQLRVQFFGLSFVPGEVLRYQYKLEGAPGDWSVPTDQRVVDYANLTPGAYHFLVRAVASDGTFSPAPASVAFRVLSPVWRRWWFISLVSLTIGCALLVFERYRAARLRALRESETRFRTVAATASDAILTIDTKGQIVFVNAAVEQIFGHQATEMVGQDLTMLMPEYLRHLHQEGFTRYQATGRKHLSWRAIELPGLHKDGHEIPLEISFGEFEQRGRRYFTGIARDITERKRAEEALQESREERLHELERVRRRIATDLHDDIGSSLTQISILSEVLRQRLKPVTGKLVGNGHQQINEPLNLIAGASRELVDSMSDIVWAINPQKDHLRDLTQRMRRFAADGFTARNIHFQLRLPETEDDTPLGANLRREIFLIFKESVNNMIKHSDCTEAEIELRFDSQTLVLTLRDNGRGFDLTDDSEGHGLVSMRDRAKDIGGRVEFQSQTGAGTTITLEVPLDQFRQTAT